MSDPRRFQDIDRIFREACRLAGDQRAAYLDGACAEDPSLRTEVEALLSEDADPLLTDPPVAGPGVDLPAPPAPEIPGFTIGRVLGIGGMGIVYEAEQERPRRRVALKVLRPGLHTRDRLKRFELEAEFLARLTHPAIGQIFDAGATADQRPYFAMELIEGRPITHHVEAAELDTRARLRLFLTVCEGVQYAHQHAVIHRDLKPSNILVTQDGRVKILDFGIARATDSDIQSITLQTDTGQLLGTLPYMSPEQASGDPNAIDTRTDVYSLGLVLFEMLTGQPARPLQDLSFPDAIQAVRTVEPTRLSSFDRRLRGDLETIATKALEHDKERRYPSVFEFADDIRRYLDSEPITARPPSAAYQIRKFARRNRALVTGVAAVMLVLLVGLVGVSLALERATVARRRTQDALAEAKRQTHITQAVNDFFNNDLLAAANPENNPGETDITVRQALDAAAKSIEGRFKDEPLVEAAIQYTIAETYFSLGRFEDAIPHARRAFELRKANLPASDPAIADAEDTLAVSLHFKGDLDAAEPIYKDLVARRRAHEGEDSANTIGAVTMLASLYADQGQFDKAEPLLVDVVDRGTRVLGFDSRNVLTAADNLAGLRYRQHRYDEAAALFRKILDARTRVLGPDSVDTISAMASLALTLDRAGKYEEAEPMARKALEEHRRILGPDHPYTQTVQTNLGLLEIDRKNYQEAERLIREVYDLRMRTIGPDASDTLVSKAMLARALVCLGRYAEAEPLATGAANGFIKLRGPDHPYTIVAISGCVTLYEKWNKPEQADEWRAKLPESARKTPSTP